MDANEMLEQAIEITQAENPRVVTSEALGPRVIVYPEDITDEGELCWPDAENVTPEGWVLSETVAETTSTVEVAGRQYRGRSIALVVA